MAGVAVWLAAVPLVLPMEGRTGPGAVDLSFNPAVTGEIRTLLVLPEDSSVVGGALLDAGLGPKPVIRLHADGTMDSGFSLVMAFPLAGWGGAGKTTGVSRTENEIRKRLNAHVERLRACQRCPNMIGPVVSGGAVVSRVMLVGQAPGDKEPRFGRPFAWTAGKTLFRWFDEAAGMSEAEFRRTIYMAAVCRCFPGKKATGGDRVPSEEEIANCSVWLEDEARLLKPQLIIAVGKLAISQFVSVPRLEEVVGRSFPIGFAGQHADLIPLPHPSGASPWHRMEPGKTLLRRALRLIVHHPAFVAGRPSKDKGG